MTWRERYRERKRLATIPPLLAQDLDILAGALRAGASFVQAVEVASRDNQGPLAEEWSQILHDMQRGSRLAQALTRMEARVPLPCVRSLVSAVTIVQQTGGNLAGVLLMLSESVRQELAFQSKLGAMTAQGQLSGYVVSAMPFLILGVLGWLAPDLMQPLFASVLGWMMIGVVIVMVLIGTVLINKIVTIEV